MLEDLSPDLQKRLGLDFNRTRRYESEIEARSEAARKAPAVAKATQRKKFESNDRVEGIFGQFGTPCRA